MSAGQIDTLLDIWAATLIKHDDSPPFTGHRNLYETIDSTPLGDVSWQTFSMSYSGTRPAENVLPWMTAEYDVWFRDPHLLVHNMLSNPDFAAEIEYVPYRDYTDDNKRCYKNFLSGDWAWKQAVCYTSCLEPTVPQTNSMLLYRILSHGIQKLMDQCLCP
jgi:hypothetical protein